MDGAGRASIMIRGIRAILGAGISGMVGMVLRGITTGTMAGTMASMAGDTGMAGAIVLGAAGAGTMAGITGDTDTTMAGIAAGIVADGTTQAVAVPHRLDADTAITTVLLL